MNGAGSLARCTVLDMNHVTNSYEKGEIILKIIWDNQQLKRSGVGLQLPGYINMFIMSNQTSHYVLIKQTHLSPLKESFIDVPQHSK